jgi:hypothetical protein
MREALAVNDPSTGTAVEDAPAPPQPEPPTPQPQQPEGERDPKTGQFKKPPKPRNDVQARIDQAIKSQRDAERRAEAAERRAQELEAARKPETPPPQPKPPQPPPPPQAAADPDDPEPDPENLAVYADGQFDRKYLKDQARWEARQEYKAAELARQRFTAEQARTRELETHATKFTERLTAADAEDPGFMDRVHPKLAGAKPISALAPGERPTFANFLAEQVFRSEHPRDLMLHLSDEAEVQRLATLPPDDVIRDLARFEARLGAASPAAPAPSVAVSHAKPPIQPLGSSPHAADPTELSDDLPIEEWIKRGNAKDRASGRR